MKKLIYFILVLAILMVIPACTNPASDVTLKYENSEIEIFVGDIVNIKPIVEGANEEKYVLNYELSDSIAEIDNEGNLTALEEGIIDVIVTVDVNPNTLALITVIINSAEDRFTVTLDVNGGDALENNVIIFVKGEKVELPTPTKQGYTFLGWFDGDVLVTSIKNRNYDLVAKWESLDNKVTVSYELNDNVLLSNYKTRKEMVDDFVEDLQSVKSDTYTYEYLLDHEGTGYGILVAAPGPKTFFSNEELRVKWGWVLQYVKQQRIEAGLDVEQYDLVMNEGATSKDAATINLEVIAFITERKIEYVNNDVVYKTSDYSTQEKANGFWNSMHEYLINNNVFKKETQALKVLPEALKIGVEFEGWYTSSDLSDSSKITSQTKFETNVTLYPKFKQQTTNVNVTFDYNGGVSGQLYSKYGSSLSQIKLSGYNGEFWDGTNYASNIYISDKDKDPKATFSTRIYIGLNEHTELYEIINIQRSGETSYWPIKANYVITISGQYSGSYDDGLVLSNLSNGKVVIFDKDIEAITSSNLGTVIIYDTELNQFKLEEKVDKSFTIPTPIRIGYRFEGWYDDYGNKYENVNQLEGMTDISLYAIWRFKGQIIGEFEDLSWVVKGDNIQLLTTFIGDNNRNLVWKSETEDIATVSSNGTVTGVKEGLATIIVSDSLYPDINFTFYVTVFDEDPTGILGLIADSNNASIFTRNDLIIGIITEPGYYYANVVGSVSKLLFEEYVEHKDYYLSNPNNKSTLNGESKSGIDFITFHYAADMNASPTSGGKNLASWNRNNNNNGTQASWHFGTGPDGVWACQNEAYGAWHAGSSKAMKWYNTGIEYKDTDPEFAKITLGSDNYFYLNGQKTKVANTTQGTRLNNMGLAFKVVDGVYYISGHYYNSSYRYISSVGGNNNSIGIESSCAKGSDLWLTWQYSAQLCAHLLLDYELPLTRLVGHHFFSGKWCPQPMLEYDMEIWWEFIDLTRHQMELFDKYSDYELSISTNSEYITDKGRIQYQPDVSECVTYTVTYTKGTESKSVTLSTIIPGISK